MNRLRTGLSIAVLTSAACSPNCGNDAAPVVVASDASSPGDAAVARAPKDAGPTELHPLCAAILGEETLDAGALETEDRTSPGPRVHCVANPRAAWAVRIDRLDAGSSVRQTILFAEAGGARAKLVSTLEGVEWPPALGRHSALFDFDGDGIPEFFTVVPKDIKTFAPAARNFVTYKGGKISPYPTPSGYLVDAVSDMDGDGRGDLRMSVVLGKRTVCTPAEEGPVEVEVFAHALADGKFSLTDDAAASFTTKRCPSKPTDMFGPSMDKVDPRDLSLSWVSCSRLYGKSAETAIAELQTACTTYAAQTAKCQGPCRHLPDAILVAKFPPPLQLKEPADGGAPPK